MDAVDTAHGLDPDEIDDYTAELFDDYAENRNIATLLSSFIHLE